MSSDQLADLNRDSKIIESSYRNRSYPILIIIIIYILHSNLIRFIISMEIAPKT